MALDAFHPAVGEWFSSVFPGPTLPQRRGWSAIARGESTLILAPTGSGKTLAAFLWGLNRVMFEPAPAQHARCRVLYVSPLKALAVDVERNLRGPLAGIAAVAEARQVPFTMPGIAIRTGDTPAPDRARFARHPADILITTPESLFLLLTSNARERLVSVETVIVDEIHALVPGKRGAHLALSLERLEALRSGGGRPLQRIGLSATQRPLEEVARFLGGADAARALRQPGGRKNVAARRPTAARGPGLAVELHDEFGDDRSPATFRPVTIVNASEKKRLELRIEVPAEELARTDRTASPARTVRRGLRQGGPDPRARESGRSIWSSIYPRLLELIRTHHSTLLFVNSRRLAERLAGALNELAGEPLVRSHHGSLARAARTEVEDLLKAGQIRALVATSSLELGIDMGAIDLVVQVEAPPSVASGLQRIGRAGHQAGASSAGIIFPKFRGDLVACAAVTRAMHEGAVEAVRYPRNPLDVLAQHIVAIAAMDVWQVDDLFALVRQAAPYAQLSRRMFEGVLDMLSGRYPSDEFAELRPRITWDRIRQTVTAREGARRVVIANAGTIPDRGLFGVFLAGADRPVRVGELDEEMVFETRVGETFTLGASTWRVEEITHDRVLVSPAPGEPGKMPFWHGDQAGRPAELGYAIGALVRALRGTPPGAAVDRLVRHHDLDRNAAEHLLTYLADQAASAAVPDDRTIVIERCQDELGDWRLCVLSPLGSRVHAPWAMAATASVRARRGLDIEVMWSDDGFVARFPAAETTPDPAWLLPDPVEVEALVVGQLGATSLFAARFRETAARALLLPRRRPGTRTPLWQQRKRAADLLAVASRFGSFPALLETYREILRDHFDMPGLVDTLRRISARTLHVATVDSRKPSPFAASLLFSYVANYIYDGDAPLAERRAQALSVDQAQLRELIGDAELRELLDPDALDAVERQLQRLDDRYKVRSIDGLHDLLLRIGDLSGDEIAVRSALPDTPSAIGALERAQRIVALTLAGERRYVGVEDVTRYRDALGATLPPGLPPALLEPVEDPAGDLALRYARTHGPFSAGELAARYGLGTPRAEELLGRLREGGRLIEGEFRPRGVEREWVDVDVLRSLRRRSLARLRHEAEPVEADALGRLLVVWHGVATGRRGVEAVLDAVDQLQGAPIPASVLEDEVLPARVEDYQPAMLDTLMAAGEVVWVGVEPLGGQDGRIALYRTDHLARLRTPIAGGASTVSGRAADVVRYLREHGASFFAAVHGGTGEGFPQETVDALWTAVWQGLVTNDTLHPVRAYVRGADRETAQAARRGRTPPSRPRRLAPPTAEGRWSLVDGEGAGATSGARGRDRTGRAPITEWAAALAQQLLTRHGVVTRETVASESVAGGFATVYPVLKAMEDAGRIRRGYFVAQLGAAQFAMPAAVDLLRSLREPPDAPRTIVLAATDPANPYGGAVRWPDPEAPRNAAAAPGGDPRADLPAVASGAAAAAAAVAAGGVAWRGPTRTAGARVVLVDGHAAAYLRRGERQLLLFPHDVEPQRSRMSREVARALVALAINREEGRRGMLIAEINGVAATEHPAARLFVEEGFARTAMGLQVRVRQHAPAMPEEGGGRDAAGIGIAAVPAGGVSMADNERDMMSETPEQVRDNTSDAEHDRVRSSNDRDQELEREGTGSAHNRGYDEAVGDAGEDIDPDSAEAENDRDDTLDNE